MGFSNSTAVGAYLEITGTYTRNNQKRICPEGHRIAPMDSFCPVCGSQIETKDEEVTLPVSNYYHLFDDADDEERFTDVLRSSEYFSCDSGALVVMGNQGDSYSYPEDRAKEITVDTITLYVEEFKKDYAEFLEWLDNSRFEYELKFGVLNYTD